jgi:hypothetical protein
VPLAGDPEYDPGNSPTYSTSLPSQAEPPDMVDDSLLVWAQRCAGLGAVLAGLTGAFLTLAIIGFSREDRWGRTVVRGLSVNAWPFLGGALILGVGIAVAITIFVFAYRLTAAPRAGRGVFIAAAVLLLAVAALLAFAPEAFFGAEGEAADREQAGRIGAAMALATAAMIGVAAALTTRVLGRRDA